MAKRFDGPDYNHARDSQRLSSQLDRVFMLMRDGSYRTLGEISRKTGAPESSVSAQLRNLRKPRLGSNEVNKRYVGSGLFEYQLIVNKEALELVSAA